jgi:hypothetical protein
MFENNHISTCSFFINLGAKRVAWPPAAEGSYGEPVEHQQPQQQQPISQQQSQPVFSQQVRERRNDS